MFSFTCDASDLKAALNLAAKVTTKSYLPILECVKLTALGHDMSIEATNIEHFIRQKVKAPFSQGEICLSLAQLRNCIKNATGTVQIESIDERVEIKTDKTTFKIVSFDPEDFPAFPTHKDQYRSYTLDSDKLASDLKLVSYAMSEDTNRNNLCGVYAEFIDEKLLLTATNGHQLVHTKRDFKDASGLELLIPNKVVELTEYILKTYGGDVATELSRYNENAEIHGVGKLNFGDIELAWIPEFQTYPDYNLVIPKSSPNSAVFNKADLSACLKRLKDFTKKPFGVLFDFAARKDHATLSIEDPELGEASEALKLISCSYSDTPKIMLDPNYLLDILNRARTDIVALNFGGKLSPVIVHDGDALHLIMPVRID